MTTPVDRPDPVYAALSEHKGLLARSSRSSQTADIVRASILDGSLRPGTRLSEPDICAALGVSRNTLREAFRSLIEERLVTHELNRGAFVRIPSSEDVGELYQCRRIVECAAVHGFDRATQDPAELAAALARADACAAKQDWTGVGTADIDFHKAIAALNRSRRLDQMMSSVWNELRLVFHVMADPLTFHEPYLARNHEIYEALIAGRCAEAEQMLADYLTDAESHIGAAYVSVVA
ncbi:GntR family transcriptional regulator [Nocardia iowensis]|uniref:GntR family transcriptional regulator n=1 Tax=Nocardia iowensis TaxID=204891 RepID=A0ABX8RYN7_NOCIO|nr:GntR family transcriptional regulator [Nocardia iowensis]QXN93964.1 GntR family transcriptional regulator [Nocardia iowensis]